MAQLEKIPTDAEMAALVGETGFGVWNRLKEIIAAEYDVDAVWNKGYNAWKFEYKYRRGGKTLCGLYAKPEGIGFMVVFGREEREKFESERPEFSQKTREIYDGAQTFRDGKWIMFEMNDGSLLADVPGLLHIKRRPNKKTGSK